MSVKIYKVGGAVRDEILGVKSKDIDYAVEAPSWVVMREYIARYGKIWLETPQYYTIRAKMPDLGDADFVLCRKDGEYTDGRRPDSVQMGTIYDDLARRDFTINAIAIETATGKMLDPHGGYQDIQDKVIRCVGSAKDRMTEDSLRMLRAIRFAITKEFRIDPEIDEILKYKYILLANVSEDRVREELMKAFKHNTYKTLQLLNEYSSLTEFIFKNFNIRLEPKSFV